MHDCLARSGIYDLDYIEIDADSRSVPGTYDFYAFNYHHETMGWLDTRCVSNLPGLKVTFVLEAAPDNPFALSPPSDFDAYCVLDPTMRFTDKRVYAFPRPLEDFRQHFSYQEQRIPVIGSFGFATPGKGFELVVDAVNREFDEAIVRINMPVSTYADEWCSSLQQRNYAEYLSELCSSTAKEGVQVVVTRDFMSKRDLIKWCSTNTLNCFLYNRDQPGLAATTDQAISSGRPLAVSSNETFRHITEFLKPYPYRSLRDSLEQSKPEVMRMQQEWSPDNFAKKFEDVLSDFDVIAQPRCYEDLGVNIELVPKAPPSRFRQKFKKAASLLGIQMTEASKPSSFEAPKKYRAPRVVSDDRKKILIVSHKEKQCGIHQYALNISNALKKSSLYNFIYIESSSIDELREGVSSKNPDAIIYNHYPLTMPWLTSDVTRQYSIPQLGIMHEVTQEASDKASDELFDFHLCPDPTLQLNNPLIYKTRRLIPPYINMKPIPETVTIGSFGFGFGHKGFERIVETVQREFDEAKIILHLPFNDLVDKDGRFQTLEIASRCKQIAKEPGIKLQIKHDFLSKRGLLDFLASNTLNAFFYESDCHLGISSTIEHALAVQRPLAISNCGMFRHVLSATPSICIDDSSLTEIIDHGIAPLVPFYNEWSEAAFVNDYERIFKSIFDPSEGTIQQGDSQQ